MNERPRPIDPPSVDVDDGSEETPTEAPQSSSDGPSSLDWWLKDGPDSPIAADIEEPEKHL